MGHVPCASPLRWGWRGGWTLTAFMFSTQAKKGDTHTVIAATRQSSFLTHTTGNRPTFFPLISFSKDSPRKSMLAHRVQRRLGQRIREGGHSGVADPVFVEIEHLQGWERPLAQVIVLDLSFNQIGDAGLTALASACASGALPQSSTFSS